VIDRARLPSIVAALLLAALAGADDRGRTRMLPGAASGREVWVALPDRESPGRTSLMHLSSDRDPPTIRVAAAVPGEIESVAAWGSEAWMVLRPRAGDPSRREVVTLESARNPASGLDYSWPREGPMLLPSLPGSGSLLAFAADSGGAWALLEQPRGAGHGMPPAAAARSLLRLPRGGRWKAVEIPGELGEPFAFAAVGTPAEELLLLFTDPADPASTRAIPLDSPSDGAAKWRRWPVAPASIVAAIGVDGETLLAIGSERGRVELLYPRRQASLRLAELPAAAGPFLLAGTSHGPWLLEWSEQGPQARRIDPISGEISPPQFALPPRIGFGAWLHLPLLGMLAVAAAIALVLFRPLQDADRWPLPPTWQPLPPLPRAFALAVDLLPGTLAAMAWFKVGPADLAMLPAWSLDAERALPSAAAIGASILWCTAWEAFGGATPGKRLVGARVRAADGGPPTLRATLLRNLFKGMVLYAPVLAAFTLLDPHGRGIGEVVSRTAVARRLRSEPGDEGG
jgi:uncharacterized RDD family membrane protein YckC